MQQLAEVSHQAKLDMKTPHKYVTHRPGVLGRLCLQQLPRRSSSNWILSESSSCSSWCSFKKSPAVKQFQTSRQTQHISGSHFQLLEELQRLEETLMNPEEKKNLTVLLGMVGGMTLKDTVGRVLKRAMKTSLARLINWSGANRKPAFKRLILKSVVLDAVRRNAQTKGSTDKEIELLITRWLQLASDRDGGRSQRAKQTS